MRITGVPPKKPNPGSRGGQISSMRLSADQRSSRAEKAGNAVLRRYGLSYYSAMGMAPRKKT